MIWFVSSLSQVFTLWCAGSWVQFYLWGSASASPPFGSAQGFELAETAPHETGEAFQTFVRREDTPALP